MRILALFFVLSGCAAAVQIGPAGPDPDPVFVGQGLVPANEIRITRPSAVGLLPNVATAPAILLNGDAVGTCRVGAPILLRVPDGAWTIAAQTQSGQVFQEVSLSGGETVDLICGTTSAPSLGPKPVLSLTKADP